MKTLRIATRNSPLARWQAEHVQTLLMQHHTDLDVELVGMQTEGDRLLDAPLTELGGKGLFIKELEQALLDDVADIAVHSMKDVTIELPEEFALPVILKRGDPRDALISNRYKSISEIPEGCVIGTSSLRRQSQISVMRPDLKLKNLRGNVGTRLRKLDGGEYDAIILAAAGMKRLKLSGRVAQYIPETKLLPAVGQGAVGIECRIDDKEVLALIEPLNDEETTICVQAERAFSRRLFGGCQLPIAGQAILVSRQVYLSGLLARVDGSEVYKDQLQGPIENPEQLGITLAETLLNRGADIILKELIH